MTGYLRICTGAFFVALAIWLGALMAAAYLAQAEPDRRPARVLLASPAQGYGAAGKEQKAADVARQRLDEQHVLGMLEAGQPAFEIRQHGRAVYRPG